MADFGQIIKGAGVSLDRAVTGKVGSIIEDKVRGQIGDLFGKGLPKVGEPQEIPISDRANYRDWISTSYAAHLTTGDFRPKLKFLFKVEFQFDPAALADLGTLGQKIKYGDYSFFVTKIDKPKFEFEYEDSVNQYNFNTKVLRRVKHKELSISFMDDTGNKVFDFFTAIVTLFSPVVTQDSTTTESTTPTTKLGIGSGMLFSSPSSAAEGNKGTNDLANRRAINTSVGNAISKIRVKQMFLGADRGPNAPPTPKEVIFDFVNPRIMTFDMDELSHEDSNPSALNMTFDFDWMEMVRVDNLAGTPEPVIDKARIMGASADILGNVRNTNAEVGTSAGIVGGQQTSAGNNNPFAGILGNIGRQVVGQVTNEAINRAVKIIPGNGRFASMITQPAASSLTSSLTSNLGSRVSSGITGYFNSSPTSTNGATTSQGATNVPIGSTATVGGAIQKPSVGFDSGKGPGG